MSQMNEQDARNLLAQHREYKARVETLYQQINAVQSQIDECTSALNTINELKEINDELDTMVPIGAGSYLHAKLTKPDTVVVNIGAGISVEKTVENAIKTLNRRKDDLTKTVEQLQSSMNQLTKSIEEIENKFQDYSQSQQRQPPQYSGQ
ncbi:prefoldin subunit alpha [Methanosalsum natronophilum]|uniref:Prefoldin subunit alpha n=1 Tax=Methanosalsum natronophilum TaxID=768733 RepID=A0A3R7VY52_9EURY|nr:prefoldin subunit alpha [Methanosalsum natronophilum]MCS3922991.1 prefoldin alpha subunit [Methanosalsum natronophilum]RQD85162.1 MAG: prefoldin subunit alpha [Methanosalsum natronophilum]